VGNLGCCAQTWLAYECLSTSEEPEHTRSLGCGARASRAPTRRARQWAYRHRPHRVEHVRAEPRGDHPDGAVGEQRVEAAYLERGSSSAAKRRRRSPRTEEAGHPLLRVVDARAAEQRHRLHPLGRGGEG
jgi:hypothetical protein